MFERNPNVSTGGDAHAPGPGPHAICEVSRKHPIPKTLYSVASGGGIGGLRWSADGQAILFSDQTLELLSRFGGAPVQITHDGYSWLRLVSHLQGGDSQLVLWARDASHSVCCSRGAPLTRH